MHLNVKEIRNKEEQQGISLNGIEYRSRSCLRSDCGQQLLQVAVGYIGDTAFLHGVGVDENWRNRRKLIRELFKKSADHVMQLYPYPSPGNKSSQNKLAEHLVSRTVLRAVECARRAYAAVVSLAHKGASADGHGLIFASTDKALHSGSVVKQVDVPTRGRIVASHVPTSEVLMLRAIKVTRSDGTVSKVVLSFGALPTTIDGSYEVLAEIPVKVKDLDENRARAALEAARCAFADASELAKAEALIRVEAAEAILNAVRGAL